MASSKKGKKVVNQEELRRLMREKQRQSTDKKRVESPFAKYNSLGHLSCTLCNVQVKSELLWPAHVLGKQHKEKVNELKGGKSPAVAPQVQPLKRKAPDSEDANLKKVKPSSGAGQSASGLPADFIEKPSERGAPQKTSGLTLLAGVYDEDDDDEDDAEKAGTPPSQKAEAAAGLPADFFDSSIPSTPAISHSGSILKAEVQEKSTEKKENTAEALPEGFFDDPVRDAKVRNVDAPKDQMDKEWEEFQKEIRQVNTKSEAIVAEDDEEGRLERQIDEIDEQIECYKRVEMLRDKRDVVKSKFPPRKEEHMEIDASIEEEEDEEELLGLLSRDWRAKGALA
ncbi:LOW QUALITY PROTEIN: zinc finger protein 830-like [Plectropomus leopardus]|uniref:zinc finger protein 830-like n=1 Tax=Plectropomus leopardus TaxID=160734 RepID=UPI001C4D9866|nr:zinc finger protein 830-like [Plectropomus leopardus]XP_042354064.1 LOW QUALITY PROTEIN: zinc finger protein 830-like [Plectropomus leopardus]